ncbi:GNAT family N-acetyltransferase [Streptococcus iniae]|uniref:GNAT family N-acetyltransferase n=1 Tax=Streptococcus iniae TaxID=1346 RepID=A0A3L8GDL9_STRIN|nr:GNAT family N-acetyltransferase [Streptococcus iniae]AGM99290.1 acetyltransferase (GNAT) family protein [Streptococcus iniae SF1]AHY16225.1 GNAT family acetyltransferase [Streptococcus iniae]AHY18089.1 GNAT family acetyltransferase [Streptococcus iniae]AJG26380.1 GNAT family acetyltransferase [Streptococcus iniae]APD32259.1 GNAT family N-acetyltransferase [Streptococcus iniae]
MEIRLAFPNEIAPIVSIIESARKVIAAYGSDQWQGRYPSQEDISDDILKGQGYVALIDGNIVAYAAAIYGNEAAYNAIYEGQWLNHQKNYLTFHRIAVSADHQGQAIAQTFIQCLIEGFDQEDFRCDTHEKNIAMQHVLEKLGYVYCGKVPLDGVRLAYQKLKKEHEKADYHEIDEDNLNGF